MKRIVLAVLLAAASIFPAAAQDYYDIDVDLPAYPEMMQVPNSPVYYAPAVDSNYFYYDGLYWDYFNSGWYASPWYNGPWEYVDPVYVPTYVLWVPVYYYRRPPSHFHGSNPRHPPRWSNYWGQDWQHRHNAIYGGLGTAVPHPAPLPTYQRFYSRNNYPRGSLQYQIHAQNYPYQPRETWVRQQYQSRGMAATQQQRNPAARQDGRRGAGKAGP